MMADSGGGRAVLVRLEVLISSVEINFKSSLSGYQKSMTIS